MSEICETRKINPSKVDKLNLTSFHPETHAPSLFDWVAVKIVEVGICVGKQVESYGSAGNLYLLAVLKL